MPFYMTHRILLALMLLLLFAGCKQKTSHASFSGLQGEKDGRPLVAIIDMSLRDEKTRAAFPWYLGISTQLTDPTQDGLPKAQEESALNDWEDSLEKEIAAECRFVYVGRVTWNSTRTLLYYVDKPDAIAAKLRRIADGHPARALRIDSGLTRTGRELASISGPADEDTRHPRSPHHSS